MHKLSQFPDDLCLSEWVLLSFECLTRMFVITHHIRQKNKANSVLYASRVVHYLTHCIHLVHYAAVFPEDTEAFKPVYLRRRETHGSIKLTRSFF